MKRFILVLAAVACMGFASAQTVSMATVGVFSTATGQLVGVLDTINLSNTAIPVDMAIKVSQIGVGDGYAARLVVMITNNSSTVLAAGDSLIISSKTNGTEIMKYRVTMQEALPADSYTAIFLDDYIVGAACKGGMNVMNYSIAKRNETAVNDGGDDIYLILSAEQSVVENALENVSIYPNPARNILNVNNVENANVNIYAINGQLVKSMANVNGSVQVDLSDMAAGMYIVRMQSGNDVRTEKIQVVK